MNITKQQSPHLNSGTSEYLQMVMTVVTVYNTCSRTAWHTHHIGNAFATHLKHPDLPIKIIHEKTIYDFDNGNGGAAFTRLSLQ